MSSTSNENPYDAPLDDKLKEHSFDGIHEYDKRLPNWWLFTLYIAIAFSVAYWVWFYDARVAATDEQRLAVGMNQIEVRRLSGAIADLDDAKLWEMSASPDFISAGKATYQTNCIACHGANLEGGIGLALNDAEWKYGGKPLEILEIIKNGSPDKASGMVAWEPSLGPKKVAEVTAYVLSIHTAGPNGAAQ